jgi:hypothetical protein
MRRTSTNWSASVTCSALMRMSSGVAIATSAIVRLLPNVWLAHDRMLRMNLTAPKPLFATSTLRRMAAGTGAAASAFRTRAGCAILLAEEVASSPHLWAAARSLKFSSGPPLNIKQRRGRGRGAPVY